MTPLRDKAIAALEARYGPATTPDELGRPMTIHVSMAQAVDALLAAGMLTDPGTGRGVYVDPAMVVPIARSMAPAGLRPVGSIRGHGSATILTRLGRDSRVQNKRAKEVRNAG